MSDSKVSKKAVIRRIERKKKYAESMDSEERSLRSRFFEKIRGS